MEDKLFEELVDIRIGDYVLQEFINSGGQAAVFRAYHQAVGPNSVFALKVFGLLERSGTSGLEEGLKEAQSQAGIIHPNVIRLHPPGIDSITFKERERRVLFIPMDFSPLGSCDGRSLIGGREMEEDDLRMLKGLLEGLSVVHRKELVHNDIKLANILKFNEFREGQEKMVLKITDFGTSRVINAIGMGSAKRSGFTLQFMAPERLQKGGSKAGDVYSMGTTLFYLITGSLPIVPEEGAAADIAAWERAHQQLPRPYAGDLEIRCPPRLSLLVRRMMSVEASERPSPEECIRELEKLIRLHTGLLVGFSERPEELEEELSRGQFPVRFTPKFHGVFNPTVYEAAGLELFVIRLRMRHPVFNQFRRLIRLLAGFFYDSFSLYETWGSFDVNMFVWSNQRTVLRVVELLADEFPRTEVHYAVARRVYHFGANEFQEDGVNIVHALAVQEGIELIEATGKESLVGRYPSNVPERSIRAFTYVEAVKREEMYRDTVLRGAIVHHVREKMLELMRKQKYGLRQVSLMEIPLQGAGADASQGFDTTAVVIDYVVKEYSFLPELPTRIIELGVNALRTVTCLETRRIVIQSGKILM